MNRPLFVHSSPQILDRLVKESDSYAMVTTSMVQALQWITNPELKLSGVYLNPDDTTFSAFRFLEITLTHRPALPIFLFEPKLQGNPEGTKRIMKNTHIKGVYLGSEPYQTLVGPLREQLADREPTRKKVPDTAQRAGHITLPISDFFTGTQYPYNVFILDDSGNMTLFAQRDSAIDPAYLAQASQKAQFFYVKEEDISRNKASLREAHSKLIDDEDYPKNWKTAEMMVSARNVLNEMKMAGINDALIEYTQAMLGDLFKLVAKIDSDEGALFGMIDRAKKCDRSVFCASYAMLICKQLKFEKTATLEILGLASILQDLALYRTPHGDLSEKLPSQLTPEQLNFYHQHPTLSADLVASHTDVPQVTLQVVRQHHERKDRSGFPNRVGGNQIHPMAEILSLINSYYDVSKAIDDDAQVIQELGKSVFAHYSENVVTAFKQVLGNILKDKIHAAHAEQTGK
jgi:response regulator RpfG family c-di-GMP phosphodiesterase